MNPSPDNDNDIIIRRSGMTAIVQQPPPWRKNSGSLVTVAQGVFKRVTTWPLAQTRM